MKAAGDLASGRGGDRRSINATLIDHLGGASPQAAWERADRWQRLAAWPEADFRAWLGAMRGSEDAEITEAGALRSSDGGADLAGLFMSEAIGWLTPRLVLNLAVATLGAIDLDPCSNSHEHPRVPAATHYTAADDGLIRPWQGRVFLNPPYGRTIGDWVDKLAVEFRVGQGPPPRDRRALRRAEQGIRETWATRLLLLRVRIHSTTTATQIVSLAYASL